MVQEILDKDRRMSW